MEQHRNDLTIYNDVAALWWSDDVRWVRTLRNLVPARMRYFDRFIDWHGRDVLDLGCAGGFMSEAIDERGASVTGIDPAEEAIVAARAHAQRKSKDITYDVGAGENLPYDDETFDAVVCVDVLEHVHDLRRTLREIARVLKPEGLFLYDTINRNPIATFAVVTMAEDVLKLLPKGAHDPAMFIRPDDLKRNLASAGLKHMHMTGLGPRGMTRRGDLTFGTLPFTLIQYIGVASR